MVAHTVDTAGTAGVSNAVAVADATSVVGVGIPDAADLIDVASTSDTADASHAVDTADTTDVLPESHDGSGSSFSSDAPLSHYFMYVVRCADDTLYTGFTNDVEARIAMHNAGKGAKYTRTRRPVCLMAQAEFATEHEARSAEFRFKRLSRAEKLAAIQAAQRGHTFTAVIQQLFGDALKSKGLKAKAEF